MFFLNIIMSTIAIVTQPPPKIVRQNPKLHLKLFWFCEFAGFLSLFVSITIYDLCSLYLYNVMAGSQNLGMNWLPLLHVLKILKISVPHLVW